MNPTRFWSHVQKTRGCWLWLGALNDQGYGRVKVRGQIRSAHRVAYELSNGGPLPSDAIVRQTCGDRTCCRPEHLELLRVTRLTPEQVSSIRQSFLPLRKLAVIHRVSHVRIWQIKIAARTT